MWHEAKKGDTVQWLCSVYEECWALQTFHAAGKPVHGFPSTAHLQDLRHRQVGMQKLPSLEPTTLITLSIAVNCLKL